MYLWNIRVPGIRVAGTRICATAVLVFGVQLLYVRTSTGGTKHVGVRASTYIGFSIEKTFDNPPKLTIKGTIA